MNDVIKKCVDELAKESPRLDYVRGMLDTILSMSPHSATVEHRLETPKVIGANPIVGTATPITGTSSDTPLDEGAILNGMAAASIDTIRKLSEKST